VNKSFRVTASNLKRASYYAAKSPALQFIADATYSWFAFWGEIIPAFSLLLMQLKVPCTYLWQMCSSLWWQGDGL